MKRIIPLLVALAFMVSLLAACGTSPKQRADDFIAYLPEDIGDWSLDDSVKLLNSTVTSLGHVTLTYEGDADALAYIVIEAHPSEDAAEVAFTSRLRDLMLRDLVFERDRAPQSVNAELAQDGRARYALLLASVYVVEINTISAVDEDPVTDEAFDILLEYARNAFDKVLAD